MRHSADWRNFGCFWIGAEKCLATMSQWRETGSNNRIEKNGSRADVSPMLSSPPPLSSSSSSPPLVCIMSPSPPPLARKSVHDSSEGVLLEQVNAILFILLPQPRSSIVECSCTSAKMRENPFSSKMHVIVCVMKICLSFCFFLRSFLVVEALRCVSSHSDYLAISSAIVRMPLPTPPSPPPPVSYSPVIYLHKCH